MLTAEGIAVRGSVEEAVRAGRIAQAAWGAVTLARRLAVLRRFRQMAAERSADLVEAVGSSSRSRAQVLTSEVLPLLAACRFLETNAPGLLRAQRLGRRGKPLWLGRVKSEIRREPLGLVLILGPANYPLFLPGVQVLQALAAGNAVLLKPGKGASAAANALARLLTACGLPRGALMLLDEAPEAGIAAIEAGVDKVFLTGGSRAGAAVQQACARHQTPSVLELSGCDAAVVMPGADVSRAVDAICFASLLNAGQTCIAPRRILVARPLVERFEQTLLQRLGAAPAIAVAPAVFHAAMDVAERSMRLGARRLTPPPGDAAQMTPQLFTNVTPEMPLANADLFLPLLSILPTDGDQLAATANACSYALGASIFGPLPAALALAARLTVCSVTINDAVAPTADPRIPFGGRRASGYGTTRGAAGLLQMTTLKTIQTRRGNFLPHLHAERPGDEALFSAYLRAAHGSSMGARLRALFALLRQLRHR